MRMLTDFHSHILPGVDDGSDCVATSMEMLKAAGAQGVRLMAATPHFYARRDTIPRFLDRRREAEKKLREAMADCPELPAIRLGAEVSYFQGMGNAEGLEELALEGTNAILVEMPFTAWTDRMLQDLEDIYTRQGLVPIVAHVERYFGRLSTHKIPERLAKLPVFVQSNAEFFLRKETEGRALRLLDRGYIHLLGSDCHNLTSRKPNLGQAASLIEKRLGADVLEWIGENGAQVLKDAL